ncbi:MAG: hypothetical protein RLZZ502_303 [Pseudomonadota bacterium]
MKNINALLNTMQGKRVYFDANCIIYFIEQIPIYYEVVKPIFELIGRDEITAYSSDIVLPEVLIKPIRDRNPVLVQDIKDLLLDKGLFTLMSASQKILLDAADYGGRNGLRTIDAIHFLSALDADCHYFVTNDKRFTSWHGLEVAYLSDYTAV